MGSFRAGLRGMVKGDLVVGAVGMARHSSSR